MASTYLTLVNQLRTRFNEPVFTNTTFTSTTSGFDQYTKDAINYAYRDICNAEIEWPFLHTSQTFSTTPGVQFYSPTITAATGTNTTLRTIDWNSFFIQANGTTATVAAYAAIVPSTFPYEIDITVVNPVSGSALISGESVPIYFRDSGITYVTGGSGALAAVNTDPLKGQYVIFQPGQYRFNPADAGAHLSISFIEAASAVQATPVNATFLPYMDFNFWRQTFLNRDRTFPPSALAVPENVFKNDVNEAVNKYIGLTPVPDVIYDITFSCWLDANVLVNTTDTTLIPANFENVILDGATKYIYEFREDIQAAQLADARFRAGIARMRIELINRDHTMKTGVYWYPHGFSYTLNVPNPT